ATDLTQYGGISEAVVDLWGNPSDSGHDVLRGSCSIFLIGHDRPCPVSPSDTPFLTMPTSCSDSLQSSADATFLQSGGTDSKSAPMGAPDGNPVGVTGCGALAFNPTLKARPTTNVADAPSGLEVDLHIPQSNSQETLATANLKDATVALPQGITINPS